MESMGILSSPNERPCLSFGEMQKRDWFLTARRLAGEGKITEAKAAVEQIKGYERFIIYREIAKAQCKLNDKEGAHSTLMTARAEALKPPPFNEQEHAIIQVISGLAEAGFYDEAKADIKLITEHDRLGMYLGVAWIQAEKEDFEAARATYREAVELQLRETPQPQQDWNLARIAESQAYVGLIEEAKRTAAMIQHPDAKKSAEEHIRMRIRPKP
jgi:tetratricopeptide (TPR) repeat protein